MPVVTFDGTNRVITEIENGDNTVAVSDIYSDWKRWLLEGDNTKFAPAFTPVGGDPITADQALGTTYFLENGWRIRPAETSHKLVLVGNIYTREPGQSVFLSTLGAFTVSAETRVSAIVERIFIDGSAPAPGGGISAEDLSTIIANIWAAR